MGSRSPTRPEAVNTSIKLMASISRHHSPPSSSTDVSRIFIYIAASNASLPAGLPSFANCCLEQSHTRFTQRRCDARAGGGRGAGATARRRQAGGQAGLGRGAARASGRCALSSTRGHGCSVLLSLIPAPFSLLSALPLSILIST